MGIGVFLLIFVKQCIFYVLQLHIGLKKERYVGLL